MPLGGDIHFFGSSDSLVREGVVLWVVVLGKMLEWLTYKMLTAACSFCDVCCSVCLAK